MQTHSHVHRYPLGISIAYLLMIPIGNWLMRDRQPFKLTTFSLLHNGFLFALSLYMVLETLRGKCVWVCVYCMCVFVCACEGCVCMRARVCVCVPAGCTGDLPLWI